MRPVFSAFAAALQPAFEAADADVASKATEARNLATLQNFYEIVGRRDYQALGECLTPDMAFEIFGNQDLPSSGTSGFDNVVSALRENFDAVQPSSPVVESLVIQGDQAVLIATDRGAYTATGQAYYLRFILELRFRDGRIAHARQWLCSNMDA